jgi:hypothetical protein
MMSIEPPAELEGYGQDPVAGRKARFAECLLRWAAIVSFIGMPVSGIIRSPAGFLACFAICITSAVLSARLFGRKSRRKCPRCRKPMEHIEIPWSIAEWERSGKKTSHPIKGGDNNIYCGGVMRPSGGKARGGSRLHMIYALKQRWYVCEKCRLCYLGIESRSVSVFSNISKERWKEAVEIVKSDSEPIEEGRVRIPPAN